jgi:hypothetical protein
MKNGAVLFARGAIAAACVLAVWLCPSAAEKKPDERKPEVKKPDLEKPAVVGIIKALADDGKSFTLKLAPTKKDDNPAPLQLEIGENTKITNGKTAVKLTVGQVVSVWLDDGKKVALTVRVGNPPGNKPVKKPDPDVKPDKPRKPRAPSKPARDPAPTAGVIDDEVDRHLAGEKIPASPRADDAEFLRRVTLDLTGRIPTYQRTIAFLDSKEPDKRRKLIDELLDSPEYAEHFATVWKNLIVPRDGLVAKGRGDDALVPWLAEQFDDNRGWDAIVTDLLTAEGNPKETPATAFVMVNGENGQPQPNKIAAAASRLFLGVNVGCAECHNHPFAKWKQRDFWGTAAFFGKVRLDGPKGGPVTLTEVADNQSPRDKKNGQTAFAVGGTAIVVPKGSGPSAGQAVKARFLGGDEAALDEDKPFRPRFAAWATSKDNPYFAQAAVNRTWAHFLGRGFVYPLDSFDDNSPSHPALLQKLAAEFASSGFDLKHLVRCITTSKTYQRTSRPVKGNEGDETGFSRVAVKVLTPEAFFDSVGVIMRGSSGKQEPREPFVRTFPSQDSSPTEYAHGIPQMLRLMNGPFLNRSAPVVDRLSNSGVSRSEAIITLYLTALSRRPTADEVKLMEGYLSRRTNDREGYRGVLWILMNSSEFALNH